MIESYMRDNGWDVTASIGSIAFDEPPASAIAALTAVDRMMYLAKNTGRNRVSSRRAGRETAQVGSEDTYASFLL